MHKEISENFSKIDQKSSENRSKITKYRGLEGSWEGLGEVLGPFCAPGLPQRRPKPKKWRKVRSTPVDSPKFGVPKIVDFQHVCDFCWLFLWSFFGSVFWRPPTTNFRGFWNVFLIVFWRFLWNVVRRVAMQKSSFCIGIYSVWWSSAFLQKTKKQNMSSKWGTFFERLVDTTFSSILVDVGLHFGRV